MICTEQIEIELVLGENSLNFKINNDCNGGVRLSVRARIKISCYIFVDNIPALMH